MTATSRVIVTGRNDTLPKVVNLPVGVRQDGSVVRALVTIAGNQSVCTRCKGWGEVECGSINPSVKNWTERCEDCGGDGITEHNSPAASWCLRAAGDERPALFDREAGRSTASGMSPDARATGDLSGSVYNRGIGEHTVLRRLQNLSASLSPALPPSTTAPGTLADRIVDALTVIAGMSVFAMIAMFVLVMA